MKHIDSTSDQPLDFDITFKPCQKKVIAHAAQIDEPFSVVTLEGTMRGNAGDYLMLGHDGEYYPCKKDIFESTYDFI